MPHTRPCPQCKRELLHPEDPHKRPDQTRCVFILTLRTHFREDDIHDGDFPHDDVREEITDTLPDRYDIDDGDNLATVTIKALEAAGTIEPSSTRHHIRGDWFSHPDGSYVVNYATGERVELSSHLYGYTDHEFAEVITWLGR